MSTAHGCHDCRRTLGDCCQGTVAGTPRPIGNRPGLPELSWRVGTHPQFLASMLAALSGAGRPGLAGLRTRQPDDLSIALLDGWATIADVLTFYTERIAQEGYLRTATERRSLVELAALVGHRPRPGLAAGALLAYTVAPDTRVDIPPGTRAQSVPDPGDLPATFETVEPLTARTEANLLPVRRTRPQLLSADAFGARTQLVVAGAQPQIRPGDVVEVRFTASGAWALVEVTAVRIDGQVTRLTLDTRYTYRIGQAPAVPVPRRAVAAPGPVAPSLGGLVEVLRRPPSVPPRSGRDLRRPLSTLLAGGSDGVVGMLGIAVPALGDRLAAALGGIEAADDDPARITHWRTKAGLFGHRAPLLARYERGRVVGFTDPLLTPIPVEGEEPREERTGAGIESIIQPPHYRPSSVCYLDAVYAGVVPGSRVAFVNDTLGRARKDKVEYRGVRQVDEVTVSALGVTTRVTRLRLDDAWPPRPRDEEVGPDLRAVLRGTTVLVESEALAPAEESLDAEDVAGDLLELDGMHRDLEPGRWVVVSGERSDVPAGAPGEAGAGVPAAELSMIASVEHRQLLVPTGPEQSDRPLPGDPVHTFLRLAAPLAYPYLRPTVRVYGNVVRATHGETTEEVLGSGDATRAWTSYALKKPPLTHLPAATAEGARSTLAVHVDGLRWREVPDFVTARPDDRCYTVVPAEDGTVRVAFGDGTHGLRPATGTENIVARYRSGQGRTGNVARDRITLAVSRPLGVLQVTNPLPATGGADPDDDEALRARTPLGVRAMDRLVSTADYADVATAYAGVGSAVADEITDGRRRVVHVTIAGVDDAPVGQTSDLVEGLRRALLELGDPWIDVRVGVRHLRLVVASARVRIDPDRRWADVEPVLRRTVLRHLGPVARRVGLPLPASALLGTMAAVPGVAYVDLDVFDALDEAALVADDPAAGLQLRRVLAAHRARTDPRAPGGIRPADLVLLSPAAPDTLVLSELIDPDPSSLARLT